MDASIFSNLQRFLKRSTVLWLVPVLTFFSTQSVLAQGQLPFTSELQTQGSKWISGPAKTSLSIFADLNIPEGYRFTDGEGARTFLKRMNNPVPSGLIGILAPNSGEWLAVLEFNEIGYVKDANANGMNFKAILKAIQERSEAQNKNHATVGAVNTASVTWESQPVYDEKNHSLEWAIRAETQSGKVINHTLVLLGCRGVLDVTMIRAYQGSSGLFPLKELAKNISFKDGQAYADYQKGDKVADVGLASLVVNDENPAASEDSNIGARGEPFSWVYYYYFYILGGGIVLVGGLLFFKKLLMRRRRTTVQTNRKHHSAATPEWSKNGNDLNGAKLNGLNGHIARKRRVSNFGQFYTNMILELSSNSYSLGHMTQNGDSNISPLKPALQLNGSESNPATATATLEFMAIQKNLIEEQRRLLQQQSKLIEEKSQLIEEQCRLLERQSDVMEKQFSLKLF
jgi:uncharacterized membrane-anchored protein